MTFEHFSGEIYKSAKTQIFPHYDSAIKLLRKRNSNRYREPQQRFTKPQTGIYSIHLRAMYNKLYIRRLQRQELVYFEVVGVVFSDCRFCIWIKSAQHLLTKQCLPFRLTIAAESLLISSLITTLTLHLTWRSSPQQGPTIANAAKPFHSHMNADNGTPHPNMYVFVQSLIRQQASTHVLTGLLAFTRAPSRTRSQKAAQQFCRLYVRRA